jgi:hypothetical protein
LAGSVPLPLTITPVEGITTALKRISYKADPAPLIVLKVDDSGPDDGSE